MAGVKGRSGGKREGAGRKKKPATAIVAPAASSKPEKKTATPPEAPQADPVTATAAEIARAAAATTDDGAFDPRPTLELVAKGLIEVSVSQQKALTALLPFVHTKKGEGGKKEKRQEDAAKVAGKFSQAAPPRLAAVGGKKL
jgi:phage terminase small subunit